MSFAIMLLILFAAALHAAWNALIKSGSDKLTEAVLLSLGAGTVAVLLLPFLPLPATASWPFLGVSIVIHSLYFYLVALAYRGADLSFAYPLMRGSAPLMTALLATLLFGEHLSTGAWLGILFLCGGILGLAVDVGGITAQHHAWAIGLGNAAVIAAYTIVDGLGVRAAGHAASYVLWMFLLNAIPLLLIGLRLDRRAIVPVRPAVAGRAFLAGCCAVGSYGLALWAMTRVPIAVVAALRETSVLFGTAIAVVALKERFGVARWVAASLIAIGAVTMKAV
jgi:drug/metabolite transporter (DMT)-like permease